MFKGDDNDWHDNNWLVNVPLIEHWVDPTNGRPFEVETGATINDYVDRAGIVKLELDSKSQVAIRLR